MKVFFKNGLTAQPCIYKSANMTWQLLDWTINMCLCAYTNDLKATVDVMFEQTPCSSNNSNESIFFRMA
jgi:hypothetical protein